MDILKKCQNLYQELRDLEESLNFVLDKQSNPDLTVDEKEHYWKEEFRIVLDMSSIADDLEFSLESLSKDEKMHFVAERIRQNAAQIFVREELK